MDKIPMTLRGFQRMQDEIRQLKNVERPQIVEAIAAAREFGDLSENAEYQAAKDKQGMIEARIVDLEDKISRAEVVDVTNIQSSDVRFGATVELLENDNNKISKFQIVGSDEADIKNGLLPVTSPLAKALIGKTKGDCIDVVTPGGVKSYEIQNIQYI